MFSVLTTRAVLLAYTCAQGQQLSLQSFCIRQPLQTHAEAERSGDKRRFKCSHARRWWMEWQDSRTPLPVPCIPAPMLFVHDHSSWLMLHGLCAAHWSANADL